MSREPDVIQLARTFVGVKEQPPKSNRGPEVDRFTGGRAEPWCGHFVASLFRSIGRPIPGDVMPNPKRANPLASVTFTERVFSEHDWIVMAPQPGDVVFYKTRGKSDAGPGRHIGLVGALSPDGKKFECLCGNWGDGVCAHWVSVKDPTVTGFGRRP